MRNIGLTCILAFAAAGSFAQSPASAPLNSGQIIQEAVKYHDQRQYKKALELYKKIPRNDTNYIRALYEMSLSYTLDSNKTAALRVCEEGLQLTGSDYEMQLMLLKGSILDDEGKGALAMQTYDSALARYPHAQELLFNKALALMRMERTNEAEKMLQDILLRNPYFGSAHMRLANCALQQGRVIPAMMALFTYLIMNPEGTHSKSAISLLDKISKSTDEITGIVNKRKEADELFAKPEQIILSKIALDPDYKLHPNVVDDAIVRQLQALVELVQYADSEKDFYMQYYVPVFKQVFRYRLFEPVVNQAFSSVQLEAIKGYLKKNNKDVKAALAEIVNYFNRIRSTQELVFTKRQQIPSLYHFDKNDVLVAKGKASEKEQPTGPWTFYYANGNTKSTGSFNVDGKKTGDWKFYYLNGVLNGTEKWEDGVQTGEDLTYNQEGVLITRSNMKDGKLDGEKRTYFAIGHLHSIENYKNDKKDGSSTVFYSDGRKQAEANYADGKLDGVYKSFYRNGKPQNEFTYTAGLLNGSYKSWYDNGQLSFEGTYANDQLTGEVRIYHRNGKQKELRTYAIDKQEGENKEYNNEGILVAQVPYKNGKADGLARYYGEDEKLYSTFLFEKDVLKTAKYFDKQGKEISTSERKKGNLELTTYNPEGFKTSYTMYNDAGKKTGASTYFYTTGKSKEINDYKDGWLEGYSKGFFENGAKKYEIAYRNGEKNGPATWYYINGQVKSKTWYLEDHADGDHEVYNEKGKLTERGTYAGNDLNGSYQYFFNNGTPDYEEVYKQGWLTALHIFDTAGNKILTSIFTKGNGKYTGIYPGGKKRFEGNYVQGEFHGAFTTYFFDGSVRVAKTYDRGLLNGAYTEYHFGGQPAVKGLYELGAKKGTWKYYNENGKLWKEETYTGGQLNGKVTLYDNGVLQREIIYKDGERHGLYKRFAPDGQFAYALIYKDGTVTGYTYNDRNGQPVATLPLPGGNGKVQAFFANGMKSAELSYVDGTLHGPFTLYHPNGKTWFEETLEHDNLQGKMKEYYNNGALRSESNYYYDNNDGPYKEYYENGKLKMEGVFYNGTENGTFRYYDVNGKLTAQKQYYYGLLIKVTK